jgi:uncharacterized protein YbbC (DUF1343 family)
LKNLILATLILAAFNLYAADSLVKTGIEVLRSGNFKILEGKKVGLVTNASGVDSQLKSTVDILYEAPNVNLVALYGPEHGVRGNVEGGEKIDTYTDEYTQLPVYSLYGNTRKPTAEMLETVDAIVYDIQDIGCRSYTFISTMGLVMEAAAENDKEVIILDRPNPLGGNLMEGCLVEDGYFSFISQFEIPYVYGLTCGELAKYLNGERLLGDGIQCELEVIPMEGWKRDMIFEETGLPWVPTSPHIPHMDATFFYVISGIVGELRDALSIGVGYTIPFESFATGWIDGKKLADKMNGYGLDGMIFRPIYYRPYYAFGEGEDLHGVQVHLIEPKKAELMITQFYFLQAVHELYPDKDLFGEASRWQRSAVNKALGTDRVIEKFTQNYKVEDIVPILNEDLESFKEQAAKYYLYW